MLRVVATGEWLYDRSVPATVRIVETDYDFWYEISQADGDAEMSETPQMNPAGRLYYPIYDNQVIDENGTFWPHEPGYVSVAEAKVAAEGRVPSAIVWT